jgi:hypothetical protein
VSLTVAELLELDPLEDDVDWAAMQESVKKAILTVSIKRVAAEAAAEAAAKAAEAAAAKAAEAAAAGALAGALADHVDPAFGQCIAFVSNQNALIQSKSHNTLTVSPSTQGTKASTTAVTPANPLVDADNADDATLLRVMDDWWASLGAAAAADSGDSGDSEFKPDSKSESITVTRELVVQVLANQRGNEVTEVQPVTSSMLQAYIKGVWTEKCPWLRVYSERKIVGGSTLTSTPAPRRCDFAVFAAVDEPEKFDARARASVVLAKDEKREKDNTNKANARDEAVGQSTQDFALIAAHAVPGEQTPCMFALSGPPSDFDLCEVHHDFENKRLCIQRQQVQPTAPNAEVLAKAGSTWRSAFTDGGAISLLKPIHAVMKHIVKNHPLAAAASTSSAAIASTSSAAIASTSSAATASTSSAATASTSSAATAPVAESPFMEAFPLMIKSNFQLPPPFQTSGAVLAGAFRPFRGQQAPSFPDGPCTIHFEAVVAATQRRFLLKARVVNTELVLKFANRVESIARERDRTERICALFAGGPPQFRDRVRLPVGYFGDSKPIVVSEVWAGRSLNRGWLRDDRREKVRELLTSQIWPVIDAMADRGIYYVDLHAGNVMVDEQLENAWLIDFEGAIDVSGKPGSPMLPFGVQANDADGLRRVIEDQKSALLTLFV